MIRRDLLRSSAPSASALARRRVLDVDEIGRRVVSGRWVLPSFAERRLRDDGGAVVLSLGDVPFPANRDPRWTVVGAVGARARAAVDPAGLVTPLPGGWSLDWWVGAEDRWHFPSREASVRQRLFDGVPVVETVMRVPGGDAIQRVYGLGGDVGFAVVECENASALPFALAFALRPFDHHGVTGMSRVELHGSVLHVDGTPALRLPRRPSRWVASTLAGGDCAVDLLAGKAHETGEVTIRDPDAMGSAAVVFPVAHRTRIRVAVGLGGTAPPPGDISKHPGPQVVARSWSAHLEQGLRVALPNPRLQAAVDAARAHLLLFDDGRTVSPDPWGGTDDARSSARVVATLERWGFDRHAVAVAPSVSRRARRRHPVPVVTGSEAWARVAVLLEEASPVWSWPHDGVGHHAYPVTEFLLGVRDGLVSELPDAGEVQVMPALPEEWRGLPVEVRGAPLREGVVSYAVRWHGDRPALLWEQEGRPVRLRAPGLDARWSSTETAGEVLLSG